MSDQSRTEGLIEFPCHFPVKVMGLQVEGFEEAVFSTVEQLTTAFDRTSTEQKPSSSGKYLSLTCQVWVVSQDQLDEVYRTLSTHPMVSVVL